MVTISRPDLLKLTRAERLQLVQDLWDSIAAEPHALPVTDVQIREVERRSAAHRNDPSAARPLDEALDRINRELG